MAIAFVPGLAARNGVAAAHLALADFACSDAVIEGRNGLLRVLAPQAAPETVIEGLGSRYEMLGNAYKPYPCGIVIHASIDACLALASHCPVPEAIESVRLAVHADTMALCWRRLPATTLEAQVSLFHWAAAALIRGAAGLEEGDADAIADARIRALQDRMEAQVDPALASGQARVEIRLKDGTTRHHSVTEATGSLERPMNDAQLAEKFRALARRRLGEAQVEALLQACLQLPDSADAGEIGRLGALG
jgi:2-methylcitrate dehydratase PrpD